MPATSWSSTARTSSRMAARSRPRFPAETIAALKPRATPRRQVQARLHRRRPILPAANPEVPGDESVAAVYSAAGCHHAAYGCCLASGLCGLPSAPGVRASASRLSNHSNSDVLPRSEPRRGGLFGYRPARATVRSDPRLKPDDFHQFVRKLSHHSPIYLGSQHRYR